MSLIKPKGLTILLMSLFAASLPSLAMADELSAGDTAWILTSTALVLFMTIPGLALFYAGLVRVKNVLSVLMQCFAITCLVSMLWFAVRLQPRLRRTAASLNQWMGGFDNLFMSNVDREQHERHDSGNRVCHVPDDLRHHHPGADRRRLCRAHEILGDAAVFSAIWLTVVYAPVCHWVWGGGWLADMGLLDFAGGTVVHVNAGVSAIVAAMVLGNRKGFGDVAHAAAQHDHDRDRRRDALGRLVRFQCRQCARGQR